MKRKGMVMFCISIYLLLLVGCGVGGSGLETRDMNLSLGREHQVIEPEMMDPNPYANTISSESTTLSSDKFPHTKAIQVQEAKYKFVVENGQEQRNVQFQMPEGLIPGKRKAPDNPQPSEGVGDQPVPATPEDVTEQPTPTPTQPERTPQESETRTPQQEEQETRNEAAPTGGINETEARVIELTNVERRNNGLSDLKAHVDLSGVARTKSNDMQENNYFSHTSPTYGSPFDMIRDFGVSYNAAAENIAQGQQTPEQVVQAWMNSEGHRKNILNGEFTHIGVGYNEQGHHWTQMFIKQ